MIFKVVVWHWQEKLYDGEVEYANPSLADAFTMGLYHAFKLLGKEPTGMETRPQK
jgi:hypothetical protein